MTAAAACVRVGAFPRGRGPTRWRLPACLPACFPIYVNTGTGRPGRVGSSLGAVRELVPRPIEKGRLGGRRWMGKRVY